MFSKVKKYLIDIGIQKSIPDDVYLKKLFKEKGIC